MLVDDNHRVNSKDAVYIFITQSGTTSDTNMALEYCLERGALCIGVTNVIPSTASEKCHATIEVMAGFEVAVASTKAYTCQFLQLFLFAAMLGKRKAEAQRALLLAKRRKIDSEITPSDNSNRSTVITSRGMGGMTGSDWEVVTSDIIIEKINSYVKDLESFIGKVNDVLSTDISGLVRYMGKARNSSLLLVSRGSEFPTVTEAVLKISEVTQIAASCYYSSELAHGPVALVNKNSCIILVEPPETSMQEKYFLVYEKIGTANAVPFIICTSENSSCSYDSSMIGGMVILPETNYLLQGIITAIAFQRAAHDVCVSFGNSPDVPPNLAKSVTVPT
ncbi:glutamine---fructose-6-phosphate transaminase (isomerizing) [Pancytospora epiphaga]|nr:glutamine---fructose-6-phosphate transaminase (isomerizing) [Pancytospora epiphaga]